MQGTYARVVKGPQTQEQFDAASRCREMLRLQEREERDTISQGGANMAPVSVTVTAEKAAEQLVLEEEVEALEEEQWQEREKFLNVKKRQEE